MPDDIGDLLGKIKAAQAGLKAVKDISDSDKAEIKKTLDTLKDKMSDLPGDKKKITDFYDESKKIEKDLKDYNSSQNRLAIYANQVSTALSGAKGKSKFAKDLDKVCGDISDLKALDKDKL